MERLNGIGYEKVYVEYYDRSSIAAPVTNYITIRVVMILVMTKNWYGDIIDEKGVFLIGKFDNNQNIYLGVP